MLLSTVQELTQLQEKHSTRPDVFDDVEEEQEIEILTAEITKVIYIVFTPNTCVAKFVLCTYMHH